MTDSIGVAVIGAGMAGRSHAHAYRTAQTVFGSHAPPVANGAAGTVSISRVAYGHPNSLGFEIFGTKAAASFDLSANAEFGYVDNAPDRVTNGWRRVIVGPDHPYIAAAQSMPFSSIGHGGQEFFTYQARAFLDEIAGLDRLPRQATWPTGCEICGLRQPLSRARPLAPL